MSVYYAAVIGAYALAIGHVMRKTRSTHIILPLILIVTFSCSLYSCKKEQPTSRASAPTHSVKPEPSIDVPSEDGLFRQSHKIEFGGEETPTAGSVPIIVDTEVLWRIAEPEQSLSPDHTRDKVEALLLSRIRDTNNRVIGRHYFSEFINSDPNRIQFQKIEQEMLTDIRQSVSGAWGIEIEKVSIEQVRVREEVLKSIENRI